MQGFGQGADQGEAFQAAHAAPARNDALSLADVLGLGVGRQVFQDPDFVRLEGGRMGDDLKVGRDGQFLGASATPAFMVMIRGSAPALGLAVDPAAMRMRVISRASAEAFFRLRQWGM